MLDSCSPALRHLLLMLLAAVLTWAGTDVAPWIEDQPGAVSVIGGPLLASLIAWATTLTRQYGTGSPDAESPADGAVR